MFKCKLCEERGIEYERRNLVPHITKKHPEIDNSTKRYMEMFPGVKLREPPKTSFANKDHMQKAVSKSVENRTGKTLSEKHKKSIGNGVKDSDKYKEGRKILSAKYKSGEKVHHNKLTSEKIHVSKEDLYDLYCEQKKSAIQIGDILNLNNKTIKKYLDFYGIKTRNRYEGQMLHFLDGESISPLTESEIEVIEGEILGDGCLSMDEERNKNFIYRHSCKYSEFILWIQTLLPNVRWPEKGLSTRKDSKTGKIYYGVSSKIHPDFSKIHERFYIYSEEKKRYIKRIPKDLILTPVKLLHWFLGDGCLWREKEKKKLWHIFYSTQGFDFDDLELIVKPQMVKMGIDCKIKKGKSGPALIIYAKSFERLYETMGFESPVNCYNYKFEIVQDKFEHLIKPKKLITEGLSKEESVSTYFRHYRKNGFPFSLISLQNRKNAFSRLKDLNSKDIVDGDLIEISKKGIRLVNFYHKHMFAIKTKGRKNSVIDIFNDDEKLKNVLEKVYERHGKISDYNVRATLTLSSTYKPFNFRPLLAKYIVEKYSQDNDNVLDPCSGFGGRLIGCMSVPNRIYYGVEPEYATYDGLKKMAEDLDFEDRINIQNTNFEKSSFKDEDFSLIFTSPPYYDVELYGPGNKKQSHVLYKTYHDWKIGFLSAFIQKSYNLLKDDGYFCIVVNNTANYPIADDFEEIASKYFNLVKKYRIQYNVNPFELKRTGEKFKYEPLFVFQKNINHI